MLAIWGARDQLFAAASEHGWEVAQVQDSSTVCRLLVVGPSDLVVEPDLESEFARPATARIAGPTFALGELAAARSSIFDRATACDFVNVCAFGPKALQA